jgi:hypothetical protein
MSGPGRKISSHIGPFETGPSGSFRESDAAAVGFVSGKASGSAGFL